MLSSPKISQIFGLMAKPICNFLIINNLGFFESKFTKCHFRQAV